MFNIQQFFQEARPFNVQYHCYSTAMMPNDRPEISRGGKIVLPPSALDHLTRLQIQYPMIFKLTNIDPLRQRCTHCGVLEFTADEGKCYLPYWMMRNLLLNEGDYVQVQSISLPVATYAKFRPQSVDFLDISIPRAVLEISLRNFACLTKGDVIAISYNDKVFELEVMEVKPGNAVTIFECDMTVEFDAPVGYQEPQPMRRKPAAEPTAPMETAELVAPSGFQPFSGAGARLDGKKPRDDQASKPLNTEARKRGVPNYDYKAGKLTFVRVVNRPAKAPSNEDEKVFEPFSGEGKKIKDKKR